MSLIDTKLHYLPLNRANRYELTPLIDTRWHNVTLIDTHIRYHAYVRVVGTSCNSWAQHAFCSEVRWPHHFVARSNWMGRLWYFVTNWNFVCKESCCARTISSKWLSLCITCPAFLVQTISCLELPFFCGNSSFVVFWLLFVYYCTQLNDPNWP